VRPVSRGLIVVAALGVLVVAGGFAWFQQYLQEPLRVGEKAYVIDIASGTPLQGAARQLAAEGILRHPQLFAWYGRISGEEGRIKAGEYEIAGGTSPRTLLHQLVEGRVKLHSLTLVEGWSLRDLLRAVHAHPAIRQTLDTAGEAELAAALNLPNEHPEGWFFPDTYHFARGTTDREILLRAHDLMKVRLTEGWEGRARDVAVKTPYEALILASIIEKETALARERPQISGVFSRRLQRGMKLQTDPTVIYGLGDAFDGNLTRRHLQRDTPYNTYTRTGLPPTPIGLPGEGSLLAALHPAPGDALYFVASGAEDGSHTFSATLKEHNAAVRRYLVELRERDR
jgi:UPF0755 protein